METIVKSAEQVSEQLTGVKFKTSSLKDFIAISEPGVYDLTCMSTVTEANKIAIEPGAEDEFETFEKYIANTNAFFPDQVKKIQEGLLNEDGSVKTSLPIEKTKGWFATANLVVNKRRPDMDLPMRGQAIKCAVNWVEPKDQPGVKLLRIVTAQVVAAKKGKTVDLSSFFSGLTEKGEEKQHTGETLLQTK